jgi:hypothetical protein
MRDIYIFMFLFCGCLLPGCRQPGMSNQLVANEIEAGFQLDLRKHFNEADITGYFVIIGKKGQRPIFREDFRIVIEILSDDVTTSIDVERSSLVPCNWIAGGWEKQDMAIYEPNLSGRRLAEIGQQNVVIKISEVRGLEDYGGLFLTKTSYR